MLVLVLNLLFCASFFIIIFLFPTFFVPLWMYVLRVLFSKYADDKLYPGIVGILAIHKQIYVALLSILLSILTVGITH